MVSVLRLFEPVGPGVGELLVGTRRGFCAGRVGLSRESLEQFASTDSASIGDSSDKE